MIHEEDIIKTRLSKDATHKKNTHHTNTHHTRQGGRTDLSTSSQGLSPSGTDRVMWVLSEWGFVISGYVKLWARDIWEFIKIMYRIIR